jgi:hypothetical protein
MEVSQLLLDNFCQAAAAAAAAAAEGGVWRPLCLCVTAAAAAAVAVAVSTVTARREEQGPHITSAGAAVTTTKTYNSSRLGYAVSTGWGGGGSPIILTEIQPQLPPRIVVNWLAPIRSISFGGQSRSIQKNSREGSSAEQK